MFIFFNNTPSQNYWGFGLSPSFDILGNRKQDDGETPKPSNSECDTPSSEPFRTY
jgi:hypothetical protein